ncbi:MAG: hypothetical protein A2X30_09315 [Elusimicrobia bacterium GWB2_63_16]|nr:MAG: hypothetical protein A2X30_09315 [Elusimicrobia bacterium GWB2_63_16]
MLILGINSVYHESSACILKDGKLIAFAEEERFNRIKHGKEALPSNAHELPVNSIRYCLSKANASPKDIAHIAYSFNPLKRSTVRWPKEEYVAMDWGSPEAERVFLDSLKKVQVKLEELGFNSKIHWIDHQVAHGASAYYYSPYKESAVLSLDGIGESDSTALMYGNNESLITLETISYPNSIGFMWEKFCKFLGFSEYHACKLMGLAAYGDPGVYKKEFAAILKLREDGSFSMDNDILKFRSADFTSLENLFGFVKRERKDPLLKHHENLAACLQEKTNEIVLGLARKLHKACPSSNICLAGGVALNCVSNSHLLENGPFKSVFVQPSANDAGTSLGSASYVWHHLLRNEKSPAVSKQVYYGPDFSEGEYEEALCKNGLTYTYHKNIEEVVARLVSEGQVVGWFQGAMEFGPRALGNRSLVADPRNKKIREILNVKVKHRELFRPFAPSVLEEKASEWFKVQDGAYPNYFMLMINPVAEDKAGVIPSVVHVDGTARIQKVSRESNPKYHKLISHFYDITGVPLVLNTSFNDDEPIVCSPYDAINTFCKTRIDYLALGNLLVERKAQTAALRLDRQEPAPQDNTKEDNRE